MPVISSAGLYETGFHLFFNRCVFSLHITDLTLPNSFPLRFCLISRYFMSFSAGQQRQRGHKGHAADEPEEDPVYAVVKKPNFDKVVNEFEKQLPKGTAVSLEP